MYVCIHTHARTRQYTNTHMHIHILIMPPQKVWDPQTVVLHRVFSNPRPLRVVYLGRSTCHAISGRGD